MPAVVDSARRNIEGLPMIALQPETEQLARQLAVNFGTTPEAVIREAVLAKAREAGLPAVDTVRTKPKATFEELMAIAARCAARPTLDPRTADEILGYDDDGLPT